MEKLIECKKCGEKLPLSQFPPDCRFTAKHKPVCRSCDKKQLALTHLKEQAYLFEKKRTTLTIFVARDYKGLHLCDAKPMLVKSVNQLGQYEWQYTSLSSYPAEIYNAVTNYATKNDTPKINEVIKLEITFNILKI